MKVRFCLDWAEFNIGIWVSFEYQIIELGFGPMKVIGAFGPNKDIYL